MAVWQNHPEIRICSPLLTWATSIFFNYSAAGHSAGRREPGTFLKSQELLTSETKARLKQFVIETLDRELANGGMIDTKMRTA